ncbi:MAG TPA: hypothetical protein VNG53_06885 [Bacteroidia bacterium]|nr:hypothetical protein [Bacteroidia bacterium]
MKKLIFCGIFFLSFVLKINAQTSKIIIDIQDTSELRFLDTVETKLMNRVDEMTAFYKKYKGKKQDTNAIVLYNNAFYPIDDFYLPITSNELSYRSFNKMPKLKTNKYKIVINWDSTLTNAKILGFSSLYYYNVYHSPIKITSTINKPLFAVPLSEYDKFLSASETKRLYRLIENEFLNYVSTTDSLINKNFTFRTINFKDADSLTIMPISYWTSILSKSVRDGKIVAFKDPNCKQSLTKYELENNYFTCPNIVNGKVERFNFIIRISLHSYIVIKEKWTFNVLQKKPNEFSPAINISRKIGAIGIDCVCYDDVSGNQKSDKLIWIPYSEIENSKVLNTEPLNLYKAIINSALYKQLNVKYDYNDFELK